MGWLLVPSFGSALRLGLRDLSRSGQGWCSSELEDNLTFDGIRADPPRRHPIQKHEKPVNALPDKGALPMSTSSADTAWYEFSCMMLEVYVGNDADIEPVDPDLAPLERAVEASASVPAEKLPPVRSILHPVRLPQLDLDRLSDAEARRLSDAISPQAMTA